MQQQENQNYQNQNLPIQQYQEQVAEYQGPRRLSLFILIAKTFLGFVGGTIGSLVLLIILLLSASVLQPVLSPAQATTEQVGPIFIVIIMAMVFVTSLLSSIITPMLLSYTEKERYPKLISTLYQIFIFNLVIFAFTAPIYLTTNTANLTVTAYAAGLQIVFVATASSLIMEIMNDANYPLLGVYTTLIGILVGTAINLMIYQLMSSAVVLLFAALPVIWASIGFFQAALAMIYSWFYTTWGIDFLSSSTRFGLDYAGQAEEEEEEEEEVKEDQEGGDFLKG